MRNSFLVTYDIADDKRWGRVYNIMRGCVLVLGFFRYSMTSNSTAALAQ